MSRKSTLSKRTQRFADQSLASARTAAKSGRKTAKSGWNDLTDRFEQVADRTSSLAEDTKSRIKGAEREGRRRGKAAKDALSGREPKRPGRVAGAAAIGVAFGAVMAMVVRRLNAARERMRAEQAATAVADELRQADLRDELAKRDAEPLSDAELDSLGRGIAYQWIGSQTHRPALVAGGVRCSSERQRHPRFHLRPGVAEADQLDHGNPPERGGHRRACR